MQYTSKMRMRNVPVIMKYINSGNPIPDHIALGFAAYLLFLKPVRKKQEKFYGEWQGKEYLVQDDQAAYFHEKWNKLTPTKLVDEVLHDSVLWGEDIAVPSFVQSVKEQLLSLLEQGVMKTIQVNKSKKVLA